MRVVYVLGTAGGTWGGIERHTLDLAGALTDEHEVHVLADAGYRERIPAGVQFHPVAMARSRRHPLLWWQLRQTLRDLQPDVVHAQGAKAAQLLSAHAPGLSRLGAICVGTVHGTKSGHKAYASLDGVIVVSSDIAAQVNHGDEQVIANGVGSASVRPEVLAACRAERSRWSGPLVLAVGRLVQVKGYDLLLQAWPRDVGAHLLVLGDGLERAALQQQIEMLSLQDQVTLAGYSTAVPEWLTLADALVISSHREGFPYVLVEALQAGCPVLSTAVSGVSEVLPTGLLAHPGSVTALQALLTRELPQLETLKARETELLRPCPQRTQPRGHGPRNPHLLPEHPRLDSCLIRTPSRPTPAEGAYDIRARSLSGEVLKATVMLSHVLAARGSQHHGVGRSGGGELRRGPAPVSERARHPRLGSGDRVASRNRQIGTRRNRPIPVLRRAGRRQAQRQPSAHG